MLYRYQRKADETVSGPELLPSHNHGQEVLGDLVRDTFDVLAAQESNAGDESDGVERGAESLIKGELDGCVLDVEDFAAFRVC